AVQWVVARLPRPLVQGGNGRATPWQLARPQRQRNRKRDPKLADLGRDRPAPGRLWAPLRGWGGGGQKIGWAVFFTYPHPEAARSQNLGAVLRDRPFAGCLAVTRKRPSRSFLVLAAG